MPKSMKSFQTSRYNYSDYRKRVGMASGLISEEDKQKVRESVDLVALMAERTPMKQKGRDFWCCCPVHNEKTPSCKVDPVTQLWHCFGCGAGGDVFSYLMKTENYTFNEAVKYLADKAHIELHNNVNPTSPDQGDKQRLKDICKETQAFYHTNLMRSTSEGAAKARAYLSKRNLGGSIPKEWNIGYAPGNGQLVRHLQSLHYSAKEMITANVASMGKDGRPHDRFYDRVMFPICDVAGDPIAFGGRIIGDGQPKYLNSNENPLFHKSQVLYGLHKAKASMAQTGVAIVCEGYTDVIALHQAGFTNAVATLGTALTKQHIRILSRHAKHSIVYLFDGDEAGRRAADRALQFIDDTMTPEAGTNQIALSAVTLPDNLDPADFIASRGAAALQDLLKGAKPLLEYGIMRRIERFDLSKAEGRSQAFSSAMEVLAPIKESLLAKDYAIQIAGMTHMREDQALSALAALKPAPTRSEPDTVSLSVNTQATPKAVRFASVSSAEKNRLHFEAEFLRVCAQHPECGVAYAQAIASTNWQDANHECIAESILDTLSIDAQASPARIISSACSQCPDAGGLLTAPFSEIGGSAMATARYLCEELSIGDTERSIAAIRLQLQKPESLSAEEYEQLYAHVVATQKELLERRKRQRAIM